VESKLRLIIRPLTIIIGVFLIGCLSFLAVLTWDGADVIAIFFSYLLSFGLACKTIQEASDNKELSSLLAELDINDFEIAQIEGFVKRQPQNISGERLIRHMDALYVTDVIYNRKNHDLIIKPLQTSAGVHCVKIRQSFISSNKIFYDQLPIGYFELDRHGFISKANIQFANGMGYKLSELFETSVALKDLIINESNDNIDHEIMEVAYTQRFVTIRTKHNDIANFLLITVNERNEGKSPMKSYGFLIRLRQKEINYFTDHLEKYWVDYSWKCFFEKSPYPVCILNDVGEILRMNQSFMDLTDKKKSVGSNFSDLFVNEHVDEINQNIKDLASGASEVNSDLIMHLKSSPKVFEVFLGKILNLDGKFHGIIVRVLDITQQNQLEENLAHSQRMQTMGQLVGSVAHDFNNILTAISGFCDLLLLRHGMGDPSFLNIMQIKQSADRASNLVNRLLAFSRKQTLKPKVVSPIDLFSEFTPLIHRLIGKDSGCGIPKENIKSIFEPFYTTKSDMSGTGLGLSTVYGVIHQSDAYIFVKSKVGKGTKFLILFPRCYPEEVIEPKKISNKTNYIASDVMGSGVIVLVEDEDAIRIFAKNVLTNKGYTVIDFSSAKEALEKILEGNIQFDLLLTDVLMPEMSGPSLVTKLKEIMPKIKVIFISGYAEEAFTEEYGDNRDFNFMAKPFSLKQLLVVVKEVMMS